MFMREKKRKKKNKDHSKTIRISISKPVQGERILEEGMFELDRYSRRIDTISADRTVHTKRFHVVDGGERSRALWLVPVMSPHRHPTDVFQIHKRAHERALHASAETLT